MKYCSSHFLPFILLPMTKEIGIYWQSYVLETCFCRKCDCNIRFYISKLQNQINLKMVVKSLTVWVQIRKDYLLGRYEKRDKLFDRVSKRSDVVGS